MHPGENELAPTKDRNGIFEGAYSKSICRIEQGIFFADDHWLTINGDPTAFQIGESRRVKQLDPDGWVSLEKIAECREGDIAVFCGETSYEGEGWVALESDGKFRWILKMDCSERVVEISIESDVIVAIGREYPIINTFRIPIDDPAKFALKQTSE